MWSQIQRKLYDLIDPNLKLQVGFTPLTQDNNYDVIYKQTANYRQTEPAS